MTTYERPLHMQPSALVTVFLGGLCGTALRYFFERTWPASGSTWPWGTFSVNILGAFILGALMQTLALLGADNGWRRRTRLFLGTGLCGAFTTYSALALEVTVLGRAGLAPLAAAYAVSTVIAGLVAAVVGIGTATSLWRRWFTT